MRELIKALPYILHMAKYVYLPHYYIRVAFESANNLDTDIRRK